MKREQQFAMDETPIMDAGNVKLRGGYYTPAPIARFLANWVVRTASDDVLEPSCGDGALLAAAARRMLALGATRESVGCQIQGVELFPSEAQGARDKLAALGVSCPQSVTVGDFFEFNDQAWGLVDRRFDAVIGNPPFLRYHSFPEAQRQRAFRIMGAAGLRPSKLTNSWVAFLVAASLQLKPDGRLAMVIPAELLQVGYAAQTRAFLARHFGAITLITFRRLVFPDIQQEVVLLLAEKTPEIESGIDVIELEDADDLAGYEVALRERRHLKTIDHAEEKWTQYYLAEDEIALLRTTQMHPRLPRLGQLGCVDVGVVTGDNSFFVLNEEQVLRHSLAGQTLPLVGRTAQIPGLLFSEAEWRAGRKANVSCHLLNLPAIPFADLSPAAQAYVLSGEQSGTNSGYKCRIRKLWFVVPTLWPPDAFLFRQIHEYPKMVVNGAGATSTDTIHRIRLHQPERAAQIAGSFLNSLTFAFSEVLGRSYGGGVLELEPSEAERLPVPFCDNAILDGDHLDALERRREINVILDATDRRLLGDELGFDAPDIARFRHIWRKLSGRRLGRKKKLPKNISFFGSSWKGSGGETRVLTRYDSAQPRRARRPG